MSFRARFIAGLLATGIAGWVSTAAAASPFATTPPPEVLEASPAFRYANMSDADALRELDRRGVAYERLADVPGVRTPVRLGSALHGVHVHSSLPAEQRTDSPFEILDARLALALDDFTALLEAHDVVELVHYTMYRPNVAKAEPDAKPLEAERADGKGLVTTRHPVKGKDGDEAKASDKADKPTSTKGSTKKSKTKKKTESKDGKTASAKGKGGKRKNAKKDGKDAKAVAAKIAPKSDAPSTNAQENPATSTREAVAAKIAPKNEMPAAQKSSPVEPALSKGIALEGASPLGTAPEATAGEPSKNGAVSATEPKAEASSETPSQKRHAKADKADKSDKSRRSSKGVEKPEPQAAKADKHEKTSKGSKDHGKDKKSKKRGDDHAKSHHGGEHGAGDKPKHDATNTEEDARLESETDAPAKQVNWAPPGTRHPAGLAIDVGALKKSDGRWLMVADHFDGRIGSATCGQTAKPPTTAEGRELWSIVCESSQAGLFSYVLTPNYNAAHADHFHMEIKPGSRLVLFH